MCWRVVLNELQVMYCVVVWQGGGVLCAIGIVSWQRDACRLPEVSSRVHTLVLSLLEGVLIPCNRAYGVVPTWDHEMLSNIVAPLGL